MTHRHPFKVLDGWLGRHWAWWSRERRTTNGRYAVGQLILSAWITVGGVSFLVYRHDEQVKQEQRDAIVRYKDVHVQWIHNEDAFQFCRAGIPASVLIRAYFTDQAEKLDREADLAPDAEHRAFYRQWADDTRNNPFLSTPARTEETCAPLNPGDEPKPPGG